MALQFDSVGKGKKKIKIKRKQYLKLDYEVTDFSCSNDILV